MTISSSTFRKLSTLLLVATLVVPTQALAAVKIIDVLYDPPGADQGHEWIEVANTGTDPVSLSGYRLYEGGTNHKLTVAQGTSTLAGGAKAIIATDPAQYKADYPAFAGAIFKSSFSLSNSGETIELKDASLTVVDSYSYTAPPVVKTPVAKKTSTKASKTTTSATAAVNTYAPASGQSAALPLSLTTLPSVPDVWIYSMGLVALLLLGAGAALYARPTVIGGATSSTGEEFEIEG